MLADHVPGRYAINQRVDVHVTRYIPSGLLGHLNDGTRAIVRNREVAWQPPTSLEGYVGQTLPALVIGYNPLYREVEVSLRLVQRDPWRDAPGRYPHGARVQGRVCGLVHAGVFVELEPGLEGFLPRWALPIGDDPIEHWFWPADGVLAAVHSCEWEQRRLVLNLRALLSERESAYYARIWGQRRVQRGAHATVAQALSPEIGRQLWRMVPDNEAPPSLTPLRILLIEDDDACAAGLQGLFRRQNCQMDRLSDGLDERLADSAWRDSYDLIVIDWNLPGPKGHEVVERLQGDNCPVRMVMLAGLAPSDELLPVWERLRDSGIDVFVKSDNDGFEEGLRTILSELRAGHGAQPGESETTRERFFPPLDRAGPQRDVATGSPAAEAEPVGPPLRILDRLRETTGADTVMLLRLEPGQPTPTLDSCSGDPFPMETASPDLIHSPLADVLWKAEEVCETVTARSIKYRRLLELAPFRGFLGLPVSVQGTTRYGLILLRQRGAFDVEHRREARLASYVIAGVLQERHLMHMLSPWQSQRLAGQLADNVMHEVNGKLIAIRQLVQSLRDELQILRPYPSKAQDPVWLNEVLASVEWIARAQQAAEQARAQYLGLTVQDQARAVDLEEIISGVISLLRPQAQLYNIVLERSLPDELPPVCARRSELQGILVNLLLNAMQQMHRIGRKGQVSIEVCAPPADTLLQVRVRDEGPGIHAAWWERVFEFGFSTRSDGAGLGLTISRKAAQGLGGDLRVEESHILWGTTFLWQIPKGS